MRNCKRWTEEEKAHVLTHYPAISTQRLTELLSDRSAKAIYEFAYRSGIRKNHDRLREQGAENIQKRKDRQPCVFEQPPPISS